LFGSELARAQFMEVAIGELDRRRLPWAWVEGEGDARVENALAAIEAAGLGRRVADTGWISALGRGAGVAIHQAPPLQGRGWGGGYRPCAKPIAPTPRRLGSKLPSLRCPSPEGEGLDKETSATGRKRITRPAQPSLSPPRHAA